jgi:hypothetical protein
MNKEKAEEKIVVKMKRKRLVDLLKAETELLLLESGGVDNWSWYSESLNPEGEEDYFERMDNIDRMVSNLPDECEI